MITLYIIKNRQEEKKKVHPVEKNPLISFFYPRKSDGFSSQRVVRLIAANDKYFIGLQVNDKNRFKKFRKDQIWCNEIRVLEFNSQALIPKPKKSVKSSTKNEEIDNLLSKLKLNV